MASAPGSCVGSWWLAVESVASAPGSLRGQLVASGAFQKDQKNYHYVPDSDINVEATLCSGATTSGKLRRRL